LIRAEAKLDRFPEGLADVAVRMIHACGMVDLAQEIGFSPDFYDRAKTALAEGAPIICDTEMVRAGIVRSRLPAENEVVCALHDPRAAELAQRLGTTRTAAAIELWRERLGEAVVAIGNAPTALFRLLEIAAEGGPRPAAVVGVPVGFVGAAESKAALAENPYGIPYLVVFGRRGGSGIAAAAVNGLAGGLP